jgi:hypothetical protein
LCAICIGGLAPAGRGQEGNAMSDQREPWLEQHDRHVMDWVAYRMTNVKNQEAHPPASP